MEKSMDFTIKTQNLTKSFERTVKDGKKTRKEDFLAVNDITLEAKSGEIVGILGPNGAGKTTLLRMLGNLMTPTSGEIIMTDVSGEEIIDITRRKETIGYLSGNTKLYPRFSIREYLGFLGEMYEYQQNDIEERIEKIIEILDMGKFADQRIEKLSTGQTQRASIARCLMADPKMYILDEPTLGLDILSADAIIKFMKSQKEKGKVVLYSTHYLEEAEVLCDRVYMICNGKVVAHGSPKELMNQTKTDNLRAAFHAVYDKAIKDYEEK